GAGTLGIPGNDGSELSERLVGLAAVMQRNRAGNGGVEAIGLRCRRTFDQHGAALDQQRGGGTGQGCTNDGLGGRLGAGAAGTEDGNGKYRACGKRRGEGSHHGLSEMGCVPRQRRARGFVAAAWPEVRKAALPLPSKSDLSDFDTLLVPNSGKPELGGRGEE